MHAGARPAFCERKGKICAAPVVCLQGPPVIRLLCYDYIFQTNQESWCVRTYFAQRAEAGQNQGNHRARRRSRNLARAVYARRRAGCSVCGAWLRGKFYIDRETVEASAAFDAATKAYQGRIGSAPDPADPNQPFFHDEAARSQDAMQKFIKVADKYPSTNPGKLARYYSALCLEDLERHNQALEELKKISGGGDKELAAMAQYQMAIIYSRTGKPDDAVKLFRALADKQSALVPRPLVLLELAGILRNSNPTEAATIYQQIKKEFPDTTIADQADRGLDTLSPKS